MAWRLTTNLVDGTVDNTAAGKVTGELRFVGRKRRVRLDLAGDFQGELRGKRLVLRHSHPEERNCVLGRGQSYMVGFKPVQRGEVGNIYLYDGGVYIEWYGEKNGRVVIELCRTEVEVVARNNG